jgi:aspartyl-tRNA(Asn)/glutamyl-tRNA(Gln) amidotransferase subunit A
MKRDAIADLTAHELVEHFRLGQLSPVEAAKACLARIEQFDSRVNAYCLLRPEETLAAARASEQRWRDGASLGPIDGVPVAVKEMFLMRGWPNRKGSKVVDPAQPWPDDAPAIAALRRHGFVPLGRTTTPEFGWKGVTDSPLTGITRNPWDPTRTAGGSSGGSAAAVALGMGPLALGTDAGGSIRIPAAFCGIVGFKPTHGVAPMWPPSAFWPLAHVGPMTWTVADTALLLDILAEPDPRDAALPPPSGSFAHALDGSLAGLRIAYSANLGYVDVEDDVARAVAAAARVFTELGAHVEDVDPGFSDPAAAFAQIFYGGAANALRDIDRTQREQMDPSLIAVAEHAARASMLDYLAAMNARAALTEQMGMFHQRYDLLLTPALPLTAFTAGREVPDHWPDERWPSWTPFTYPFNLTGQPAISVPCGFATNGLPIGLQLVGARHHDTLVLRAAHGYQRACSFTTRRPSMLADDTEEPAS